MDADRSPAASLGRGPTRSGSVRIGRWRQASVNKRVATAIPRPRGATPGSDVQPSTNWEVHRDAQLAPTPPPRHRPRRGRDAGVPLAAQAADYRAQLSESFNSGLAAARPAMTLNAVIDNGSGGVPVATGVVRFNVDTRHLTSSAWASMLAAPAGHAARHGHERPHRHELAARALARHRRDRPRTSAPASTCRPAPPRSSATTTSSS